MAGLLVRRFLDEVKKSSIDVHDAFERAFYLSKMDKPVGQVSLRDTDTYSMPKHTVQRASILLNESIKPIGKDAIIANVKEIIKNKEYAIAGR